MISKWNMLFVLYSVLAVSFVSSCEILDPADANKVELCPNLNLDCIQNYFAANFDCKRVEGPVSDPPPINGYPIKYANSNITLRLRDVSVKGLNGKITDFYMNTETEELVMVMETQDLQVISPKGTMSFNQKGEEPIKRTDFINYTYGVVTFTAVIPNNKDMKLNEMEVSSFVEDSSPPYTVGPDFSRTSDPTAINEFQEFNRNVSLSVLQEMKWQEDIFVRLYINNYLCNFNCN